ncbi:MAG: hypothetical protein AAGD00_11025 [Planctomycetota bacterium]
MGSFRNVVLIKLLEPDPGDEDAAAGTALNAIPLGRYSDVIDALSNFNTAPDNAPDTHGLLFGPGIIVQMPMVGPDDNVMQAMVSVIDEDNAWAVLSRACRTLGWKMMDPASGRTFG